MRDRRHQLANNRKTRGVGKILARRAQFLLRLLALCNIPAGIQYSPTLDRYRLQVNEQTAPLTGL